MLEKIAEVSSHKHKGKSSYQYVRKHLFFEVQPPRFPDFSLSDFYLRRHLKPPQHSPPISTEVTFHHRVIYARKSIRNLYRTFDKV